MTYEVKSVGKPEIIMLLLATGLCPTDGSLASLMPGGDKYYVQKRCLDSTTKLVL